MWREQHRVVRGYRGMKTADELADGGVKEITVGREVATPRAVDNVGGDQLGQRLVHQLRRAFVHATQVAGNQISARKRHTLQPHQARGMGVREDNEENLARLTSCFRDLGNELLVLHRAEHAMVEGEDNLKCVARLCTRSRAFGRGENGHRRSARAVHPGGPLVLGRAPHAVMDVRWRRDVVPRQRKPATALGSSHVDHGIEIRNPNRQAKPGHQVTLVLNPGTSGAPVLMS